MIRAFTYRDVNEAYPNLLELVKREGVVEETRNGKALVMPGLVAVEMLRPRDRVLYCPNRDANPFFHFMEPLWMLGGRNDVKWIERYNSNMKEFSDDGVTFHAAYGFRWREHWFDQLLSISRGLLRDRTSRRYVLEIWDAEEDLEFASKDLPCNTHCYFRVENGKLNLTVCNRSNDLVWGMMGANVVHFSVLLEWMSNQTGIPMGVMYQVTNNLHLYEHHWELRPVLSTPWDDRKPSLHQVGGKHFDEDLQVFLNGGTSFKDDFLRKVAQPMKTVWDTYKNGDKADAFMATMNIEADDWRKACQDWLNRRNQKNDQ